MKFTKGQNVKVVRLIDDKLEITFINKIGIVLEITKIGDDNFYLVLFPDGAKEEFFHEELRLVNH